jgi:hypothetical protein
LAKLKPPQQLAQSAAAAAAKSRRKSQAFTKKGFAEIAGD